ncbi:MAG: ccmI [Hydrocarboniphaga sp.]|uniref:c-type cytochrome biogenesis protein CcmI n=1 Tax=Hydrocarboniphaga sp. TaxID=2033016 RepID=UPI00260D9E37|nr:c-type cytochrome biogenesis protein CcmI [Hydrocarboniphaga sp.]MDB5971093.1 ccmI [Hydrocarboniphaga sp.]
MSGTMLLVALMTLLTIVTAVSLSRPWWQRHASPEAQRRASNVEAYRHRLTEIDNEVAAGLIAADAAPAMRDEAGGRLLDDVGAVDAAATPISTASPPRRAALILLLLLGVFAGGYYYWQGSWQLQRLVSGEAKPEAMSAEAMEQAVATLASQLESTPEDADGWAMLGRSYFVLQRYADSARAYAQVNRITDHRNPDALTSEGEALALAGNRDLSGRPRELFDQALAIEPMHGKSLWYAGLAAAQAGDAALARQHWSVLLAQQLPDELRTVIAQRLQELGDAPADTAPPGLAAAPESAPAQATPSTVALQVHLSLAPELRNKAPKDAVLIVFARAQSGPPMPVAVNRGPAPVLPADVRLDDSMAVMPTMKLSQFDSWVVTARLSGSGQAKAQSGDLQGSRVVTRAEAGEPLALTIDQVVP